MRHQVLKARPAADDSADATLVAMAKDGSEDAVRILVRRYNRQLFRTARGVVRHQHHARQWLVVARRARRQLLGPALHALR